MTLPIQLGRRASEGDLLGALEDCHARIRRFLELARKLVATDAPEDELAGAARDAARYFREALPQHVADEHLLADVLAGRDLALDRVFDQMRDEHALHEPPLAILVATCEAIARDPQALSTLRSELATAVADLERLFVPHLELEETALFPALRRLDPAERRALHARIRARREEALRAPRR